jgi:hypothetical protein
MDGMGIVKEMLGDRIVRQNLDDHISELPAGDAELGSP